MHENRNQDLATPFALTQPFPVTRLDGDFVGNSGPTYANTLQVMVLVPRFLGAEGCRSGRTGRSRKSPESKADRAIYPFEKQAG